MVRTFDRTKYTKNKKLSVPELELENILKKAQSSQKSLKFLQNDSRSDRRVVF
jgi:hypothetical protein